MVGEGASTRLFRSCSLEPGGSTKTMESVGKERSKKQQKLPSGRTNSGKEGMARQPTDLPEKVLDVCHVQTHPCKVSIRNTIVS
jgi:hypothetical protein